jgi:hypothetical protein
MTGRLVKDLITPNLNIKGRALKQLPLDTYKYWVSITPVKTGAARRNTHLSGNTINADYPYAKPLDDGHSRQAPKGMSKPTEAWLKKHVKRLLGK